MLTRYVGLLPVALVAVAIVGGCGDDGAAPPVPDAAAVDAGAGSFGPDIPWLEEGAPPIAVPGLTPCPDGWHEVASAGSPATCHPYPEGGALACPVGEAHFPGESACRPVGSPCPATGEFAADLPVDRRVVYVRPGAPGGDGTEALPYGGLGEFSLGALPIGTVIALSSGTHSVIARLARDVALWGACAARTVLSTTEPSETDAVVTLTGTGAELRNLTIADSPRLGLRIASAGTEGRLHGVVLSGVESIGLAVFRGSILTAGDLVVRDTRSRVRDGALGRGLDAESGSSVEIGRAIFSGNRHDALFVGGADCSLVLTDSVIRDTAGQAGSLAGGDGLRLQEGASGVLTRVLLERNRSVGLYVGGSSALATTDVVVRDTMSQELDATGGRGLNVEVGSSADIRRTLLADNRNVGAYVSGAASTLTGSDVVVLGTEGRESDGRFGNGLQIHSGASADLSRVLVAGNREAGLLVTDFGSMLSLNDALVQDTRSQEGTGRFGRGLVVQTDAVMNGSDVVVEGSHGVGLLVAAGAAVSLEDVVVRDTDSRESDGTRGRGVEVQEGGTAVLSRALVEDNRELGILSALPGASATMTDLVVRRIRPQACDTGICSDDVTAHGLGTFAEAELSAERFTVEDVGMCGVMLASDGQLDIARGEVRRSTIGACVQVSDFDLSRLQQDVRYLDNGVNLQSTELPIPESVDLASAD